MRVKRKDLFLEDAVIFTIATPSPLYAISLRRNVKIIKKRELAGPELMRNKVQITIILIIIQDKSKLGGNGTYFSRNISSGSRLPSSAIWQLM